MIIYIVTSGDYSEYSILRVFRDKVKAELYVDLYNKGFNYTVAEIEEWDTNPEPEPFIAYAVTYDYPFLYGGKGKGHYDTEGEPTLTRSATLTRVARMPPTFVTARHKDRPDMFVGIAYGKTYEHAEKNLWDAIAKAKAEANNL